MTHVVAWDNKPPDEDKDKAKDAVTSDNVKKQWQNVLQG